MVRIKVYSIFPWDEKISIDLQSCGSSIKCYKFVHSVPWIQSLEEIKYPEDSPAQKLLSELNIKMCTVEILRILLDDCKLYSALSIISDPGIKIFILNTFLMYNHINIS